MSCDELAKKYTIVASGSFVRSRDSFFDPLAAFVAGYAGTVLALDAHQKGAVTGFGPDDAVVFLARVAGHGIAFRPSPILEAVSKGEWVDSLPFVKISIPEAMPPLLAKNTGRVFQLSAQALFVQYFDSVEDEANSRHNDPLVRFAKAIRNTGAHGQVIPALDDRANLGWKGLRLGSKDRGKTLLQVGINPGDLIALMVEIADLFSREH
jgi:hypothetical protein